MEDLLQQTKNLLKLRNYSPETRKIYLMYIKQYLIFSKNNKIKNKKETTEKFLLQKVDAKRSPQTINLALNSIKFFNKEILKNFERRVNYSYQRSKR